MGLNGSEDKLTFLSLAGAESGVRLGLDGELGPFSPGLSITALIGASVFADDDMVGLGKINKNKIIPCKLSDIDRSAGGGLFVGSSALYPRQGAVREHDRHMALAGTR